MSNRRGSREIEIMLIRLGSSWPFHCLLSR